MFREKYVKYFLVFLLLLVSAQFSFAQKILENQIGDSLTKIARNYASVGRIVVSAIKPNSQNKTLSITVSDRLAEIPLRPENVTQIYQTLQRITKAKYPSYSIICISQKSPIEDLIPNFFRTEKHDESRKFGIQVNQPALISKLSRSFEITEGLQNRHIAVWQSHGWHYNQDKNRWMWQRARLFQTVEDLYTQAYVLPFLTPMLENAGATVLIPRERDTQKHETIVDNDNSIFDNGRYREHNHRKSWKTGKPGFAYERKMYVHGENPFHEGSYRYVTTSTEKDETNNITWIPEIPEEGYYAVYVSYKTVEKSTKDARYTVFHKGAKTVFSVNQTMHGGTWLYLGKFLFPKGYNTQYRVELSNLSTENDRIVTADAVKFGGGLGNIARSPYKKQIIPSDTTVTIQPDSISQALIDTVKPYTSGYPRFTEGARYWLQWAGFPDSIYSRTKGLNDYSDDFQSRGFWLNYMAGGSSVLPKRDGLRVPVDMALAFHTDAGVVKNDSIIGTLGIFTHTNANGLTAFENGISRLASRDLTDLVQTQITEDIRRTYAPEWTRRGLWNKSYSESRVPEVPTMLLELLSHQNPADIRYGHDPLFRFTVSRAIYKAILKFIAHNNGQKFTVQPLPVEQFTTRFAGRTKVVLNWEATIDPLEPTAIPTGYMVYKRIDNGGFDNGFFVNTNSVSIDIEPGKIYNFKVCAVNQGGESFPSEMLSVYRANNSRKEVMIVNAFERVSAPAFFSVKGNAGFKNDADPGVPYISDISFTGKQFEFDRKQPWLNDDNPGFGASYSNMETKVIAGNTFDYPYIHGKALKEAGYSFVSTSVKALTQSKINLNDYRYVNIIFGKQKQTISGISKNQTVFKTFPLALQQIIAAYTRTGGNLLVSGAFTGSDFFTGNYIKPDEKIFIENVLKFRYNPSKNDFSFRVKMVSSPFPHFQRAEFKLYDEPQDKMYYLESVDAIEPTGDGAVTFCRYATTNLSAGIIYAGAYKLCITGFPFESIKSEKERNKFMESIMLFFDATQKVTAKSNQRQIWVPKKSINK